MPVYDISERYSPHGKGYIKMYRKLLTSAVFQNEKLLKVWVWCLIKANWHEATCFFEGKEIPLNIGQFITGRYTGSEECSMVPSTFYKCIKKLEEMGNITTNSDNKKSILTIVNYSSYQGDIAEEWQQSNNKVTTKEQQSSTAKEVKNKRSKEKEVVLENNTLIDEKILSKRSLTDYFEVLWGKYPERSGKNNALRHFLATVKNDEDNALINMALQNYLKSDKVSKGFIKNGSTWFNEWQDWIEPSSVMMGSKYSKPEPESALALSRRLKGSQ